ncbi:hypothetical protein HUE56_29710 (plasmid) [Azospirillum oryzae]|uniref:Uncharacterized protein n=1 Tax=Azospirillum oryzae TaxID=286727 RepID=A0A6N1AT27_9PROT|nr:MULTISPECIES: hypothetical protein [Azospirillum]QKS54680.1 hypothetical protein HUE56_29710 [Azospirillum oryzae]GLR77570.1 hypothetical protein GCM10007856_02380 [Azospirillum oryzae]
MMQSVTIRTVDNNGDIIGEETSSVVRITDPSQIQEMLNLIQAGLTFEEAAARIEAA